MNHKGGSNGQFQRMQLLAEAVEFPIQLERFGCPAQGNAMDRVRIQPLNDYLLIRTARKEHFR